MNGLVGSECNISYSPNRKIIPPPPRPQLTSRSQPSNNTHPPLPRLKTGFAQRYHGNLHDSPNIRRLAIYSVKR